MICFFLSETGLLLKNAKVNDKCLMFQSPEPEPEISTHHSNCWIRKNQLMVGMNQLMVDSNIRNCRSRDTCCGIL